MNRKPETIRFYRKRLPHWEVFDGVYFVTIRRRGSVPQSVLDKIKSLAVQIDKLVEEEKLAMQRNIFRIYEDALDRSETCCDLIKSPCPEIISNAIQSYSEKNIWRMVEYVIMPNHVHMFFQCRTKPLARTIVDFKRWTNGEIHKKSNEFGSGAFWQEEWFDHWSRSSDHDEKFVKYIKNNPVKAGLVKNHGDWKWGSWNE